MAAKIFHFEIIAQGARADEGAWPDILYLIETYTISVNHVALNEWHASEILNSRDCYQTDDYLLGIEQDSA